MSSVQDEPQDTVKNSPEAGGIGRAEECNREAGEGSSVEEGQETLVEKMRLRIADLEKENSELKDQYLRKHADFENYRKRVQRDAAELRQTANKQLLTDILPVIDDFERAIRSAEDSRDFDVFHDGILLIEKQFTGMLERKWGLKRFEAVGETFDPERHEAIMSEDAPGQVETKIVEDYQKGYLLHGKVMRASKVKVSVPPATKEEEKEEIHHG